MYRANAREVHTPTWPDLRYSRSLAAQNVPGLPPCREPYYNLYLLTHIRRRLCLSSYLVEFVSGRVLLCVVRVWRGAHQAPSCSRRPSPQALRPSVYIAWCIVVVSRSRNLLRSYGTHIQHAIPISVLLFHCLRAHPSRACLSAPNHHPPPRDAVHGVA